MAVLEWTRNLSVGVDELDQQHRHLINLLDRLRRTIQGPEEEAVVGAVLTELLDYIDEHFRDEERMMEQAGYPHLELHRTSHSEIAKTIAEMRRSYAANPCSVRATELQEYLTDWVILHIGNEDIRYRSWLTHA